MKKICCILLLCCSLFVCLFATIPKNKVSANTAVSTPNVVTTNYPYFAPQNIEIFYEESSLNYTYDYKFEDYGNPQNAFSPSTSYTSSVLYGGQIFSYFDYRSVITYGSTYNSVYWTELGSIYNIDAYYDTQLFIYDAPASNDDLVITLNFPVHSYDPILLLDYMDVMLFGIDFGVIDCPAVVAYDLYYTYPGRANAGDTHDYTTHNLVDYYETTMTSGYNDVSLINSSRFYGLLQSFPRVHERIINVYGSITITLEDYQFYLNGDFNPKFRTLTHDIRTYQDVRFADNYGGGSFPNYFIESGFINFDGLPSTGGGSGSGSGFIPNLANSLLQGLNNFMAFELVPGFSLSALFALIVGIPLLIFILKLFLGG